MIKLFLSTLFLCCSVWARPQVDIEPHVVGGKPAQAGSYPFMVSLRRDDTGAFFCGGSLVSNQFVLTAAHCLSTPFHAVVGMGSVQLDQQKVYEVEKVYVHPRYKPPRKGHDVGLLKLKNPVDLSSGVEFLKFPYNGNQDGKNVTAMGWGKTSTNGPVSNTLLYLNKTTLSNKECSRRLPFTRVKEGQLCLASEKNYGVCFGDSGSPLYYEENNEKYVLGVVSWGVACARGFPDVFTRVSYYSDWLKEVMAQ